MKPVAITGIVLDPCEGTNVTPAALIRDAARKTFTTEDGETASLKLRPPLSEAEIAAFEARLPCLLPADVRELLAFCSGFSGVAVDFVDFTGHDCMFEFELFPHGVPLAADGFGNFWVVDLLPESQHWGPIYFACHDAPVILLQSPSLEHFLAELFQLAEPPYRSLIDDVHEDRIFQVWRKNPSVMSQSECLYSHDRELRTFAEGLGPLFQIIDLRNAEIGFGFSWGRYGPNTVNRRHGNRPIFAYERRKGLLARIFGGFA
jgi:cell wall assembly regulator SMI1